MPERTPIYLDHNATTPVDPRVLERFLAVERTCPGNPSSLHSPGRRARAAVEEARAQVAAALGADPDDVIFTSGATEANNLAVHGLGPPELPVLLAAVEHPSVTAPAQRRGIAWWQVDGQGHALVAEPASRVGLVCLAHGQSEVGTLQAVAAAASLAQQLGAQLHVDAAQTLGRVSLANLIAQADSVALSPHKAGGLRGTGILIVRHAVARLRPLLCGGGQEHGLRPGTVSPALAAAAALAVELACREQPQRAARMSAARARFLQVLSHCPAPMQLLTPLADSLPNTLLVRFPDVDGRNLLPALDLEGIHVSQGTACSAGAPTPPAVLAAMGLDESGARACVRISFGPTDDEATAAEAATRVAATIVRLQKKN